MNEQDFPSNNFSGKPTRKARPEHKAERVTTGRVIRKKRTDNDLAKSLSDTLGYVAKDVIIPMLQDAFVDSITQGTERMVYGEARTKRAAGRRPGTGTGYISYNRVSNPAPASTASKPPVRQPSRQDRSRQAFDDIILSTRAEANDIIDRLFELIELYGYATVSDLYEFAGFKPSHTDESWGWYDVRSAVARKVRSGFLVDLPAPEHLE